MSGNHTVGRLGCAVTPSLLPEAMERGPGGEVGFHNPVSDRSIEKQDASLAGGRLLFFQALLFARTVDHFNTA